MQPVRNGVRFARRGAGFVAQVVVKSSVVGEFERDRLWDAIQDAEAFLAQRAYPLDRDDS